MSLAYLFVTRPLYHEPALEVGELASFSYRDIYKRRKSRFLAVFSFNKYLNKCLNKCKHKLQILSAFHASISASRIADLGQ